MSRDNDVAGNDDDSTLRTVRIYAAGIYVTGVCVDMTRPPPPPVKQ